MFKIEVLENGVICQLLLIKPWEIAKKSQSYIHYYLVTNNFHTTFEDDRCCYHYLLIPTTIKNIRNNKSLLKIDSKNWYNNKNVYLKLDEIFILQDFDFRTWITLGEGKVCDWFPRLIVNSTINDWKLYNTNIWNQISEKLYKNLSKSRTMFFILDRNSFQFNSSYWTKKIRSKYVYNTNCFIPKWNDYLELYFW